MSAKRDTSGLKVIRRELHDDWCDKTIPKAVRFTAYLFSITGDATVERTNYLYEREWLKDVPATEFEPKRTKGDCKYSRRTETRQKFLCVGGPISGQRVTEAPGYSAYNAANLNRGRNKQTEYRVIFVHDSLLKEGNFR